MIKRILQNNILLSTSSFLSLLVNIFSIPIISRIYTPDDIGIFSSMQIISMIFIPLIGLRMEIIFGQNINNDTLKSLFTTTILSGFIMSAFTNEYFYEPEISVFRLHSIHFVYDSLNHLL